MKRPKSANWVAIDDVRNQGGKDVVLKRMVNHYKAISNIKSVVKEDMKNENFMPRNYNEKLKIVDEMKQSNTKFT